MNGAPEPGTEAFLERHCWSYIAALNERRFDDLSAFVADELVHNDAPISAGQYRELLEDDVRSIPTSSSTSSTWSSPVLTSPAACASSAPLSGPSRGWSPPALR